MEIITYLDIILIIPLLWFAWKGFSKGFIIELASLAALILGIYVASHFSDFTANFLTENLNFTSEYLNIIAFAITFIGVVILTHLLGRLLESVVKIAMLGFVNKIAGVAFGILKAALVLSGLFYILHTVDASDKLISRETKENSILYKPVSSLIYIVMPAVENLEWPGKTREDEQEERIIENKSIM